MAENTVEFVIRANVDQFRRAVQEGRGQFESQVRGMAKAATDGGRQIDDSFSRIGVRSLRSIRGEIRDIEQSFGDLARSGKVGNAELAHAAATLRPRLSQLRAEMKGGAGAAAELGASMRKGAEDGNRFASSIGHAAHRMTALVGAFLSLRQGVGFVRQVLTVGGEFETLGKRMEAAMRSIEGGEQATAWVRDFTLNTPFQLGGVTEAFILLKNFGLDPMGGTMQSIADQAATLGARQETLMGISLALGQAWGKQKLQGQEIMQLINQGVPVWELLEKVTGRTTAELQDMSAAGELGRDAIAGLIEEMGKVNAGAAANQMDTWAGAVSNLKDTWDAFLDTIAQSGALEFFKQEIQAITAAMAEMAETGELKEMAESVSTAIISIASAIKSGLVAVYEWREALLMLAAVAGGLKLAALARGIRGLVLPMSEASTAAAGLATSMTTVGAVMARLAPLLRAAGYAQLAIQVYRVADAHREYRKTLSDIEDQQQADLTRLAILRSEQQRHADLQVLSAEQVEALSAAEIAAYRKRLQEAKTFYAELRDVSSRVQAREEGVTAPPTEESLDASRQARELDAALGKVREAHQRREAAEGEHQRTLAGIKEEETDAIKRELAEQLKAYDDANKALETAQKRREALDKRAQDLRAEFAEPPQQEESSAQNVVRIYDQLPRALEALKAGNFEDASKGAEQLEERLRKAREEGSLSTTEMRRLADQIANIWEGVGEGEEAEAQKSLEAVQRTIEELVSKAEFLKKLEIGFDEAAAEQSAEQLRRALQAQMEKNPIIMPVVVQETTPDKRVDRLLGIEDAPRRAAGGPIYGPGTETSDSILARVSAGEYVLRAAAVRKYGRGFIGALNRMALPKFATGGLVTGAASGMGGSSIINNLRMPEMQSVASGSGGSTAPINLYLDGQRFPVTASGDTATDMRRAFARESLKRGGRVTR